MSKDKILLFAELLKSTEIRKVDFKSAQYHLDDERSKSKFVKDILCMANAPGGDGYILLGVKSKRSRPPEIIGVSSHHDSSDLEAIVSSVIQEPIQFEYYPVRYRGKNCGLIHIPLSKAKPHWSKKDYGVIDKNVFYTRRASGNRVASLQEIREMFLPPEIIRDITAEDLLHAGLRPEVTPVIAEALAVARKQGNERLHRFLDTYISARERWPNMTESWRAVIAGFPIVAADILAPSFEKLARLVKDVSPYIGKKNREDYHNKVRLLLVSILGEVAAFIYDSSAVGGFPIIITTWPPAGWPEGEPYKMEDSLIKGQWTYGIPSALSEKLRDVPLGSTWNGILFDIVSRLPDPDRQRGKVIEKSQLASLLYHWCKTAPEDFYPPLTEIPRTPYNKLKGTLAGLYLEIAKKQQ